MNSLTLIKIFHLTFFNGVITPVKTAESLSDLDSGLDSDLFKFLLKDDNNDSSSSLLFMDPSDVHEPKTKCKAQTVINDKAKSNNAVSNDELNTKLMHQPPYVWQESHVEVGSRRGLNEGKVEGPGRVFPFNVIHQHSMTIPFKLSTEPETGEFSKGQVKYLSGLKRERSRPFKNFGGEGSKAKIPTPEEVFRFDESAFDCSNTSEVDRYFISRIREVIPSYSNGARMCASEHGFSASLGDFVVNKTKVKAQDGSHKPGGKAIAKIHRKTILGQAMMYFLRHNRKKWHRYFEEHIIKLPLKNFYQRNHLMERERSYRLIPLFLFYVVMINTIVPIPKVNLADSCFATDIEGVLDRQGIEEITSHPFRDPVGFESEMLKAFKVYEMIVAGSKKGDVAEKHPAIQRIVERLRKTSIKTARNFHWHLVECWLEVERGSLYREIIFRHETLEPFQYFFDHVFHYSIENITKRIVIPSNGRPKSSVI